MCTTRLLVLTLLAATLVWPQIYSNKDLKLELREVVEGSYSGTITLQGQTYSLAAKGTTADLKGEFSVGATRFPFTARWDGLRMVLNSGGVDHVLIRERAAGPVSSLVSNIGTGTLYRHALGYSLRLAPGWTASDNPEGIVLLPPGVRFVAGRNDNPELYIALVKDGHTAAEEAQLVQGFSSSFTKGTGRVQRNGVREAMSFGTRQGSVYRWDILDPQQGRNVAFDVFGAPEGGKYFAFISVGTAELVRPRETEVRQMLASMKYEAPKVAAGGALSDSTPLAQQWLQKLKGRMIQQMHIYSGMSSEKYHYINADGSYVYKSSSMVSIDVGGASGMSSGGSANRGRWRIRDMSGQVFLEVRYQNGETSMMRITQDERNWFLNGEKAFAVDQR